MANWGGPSRNQYYGSGQPISNLFDTRLDDQRETYSRGGSAYRGRGGFQSHDATSYQDRYASPSSQYSPASSEMGSARRGESNYSQAKPITGLFDFSRDNSYRPNTQHDDSSGRFEQRGYNDNTGGNTYRGSGQYQGSSYSRGQSNYQNDFRSRNQPSPPQNKFQSLRGRGNTNVNPSHNVTLKEQFRSGNVFNKQNQSNAPPKPTYSESGGSSNIKQEEIDDEMEEDEDFDQDNEEECSYPMESDDEDRDSLEGDSENPDLIKPDPSLVDKYRYYPPSAYEMGKMFEGLVIYYYYKIKNIPEKNPFVLICESFARSGFSRLKVEDGFDKNDKYRKFCTLRWHDMILVRGVGESGKLKEPRVRAAVELINKLAMSCYTLKMKDDYFSNAAFQNILNEKERPGVFKVVPKEDVPNFTAACQYIENFFKVDSDCELVFCFNHDKGLMFKVKSFAKKSGFGCRTPGKNDNHVTVFKNRTPQYWRDKILASGKMSNEKFELVPPQGEGVELLANFNYNSVIPKLKVFTFSTAAGNQSKQSVYGPPGVGPNITLALPPWEKGINRTGGRGGFRGRGRGKSISLGDGNVLYKGGVGKSTWGKYKKIAAAVEAGEKLNSVKGYRFMSKKQKKKLKNMLNG